MKKFFAIAMLALLLFNTGGYMLLFQYVVYRSDSNITDRINNNRYKANELVEVKIPVHLNIQDWTEYQPISGQVQLKANCYDYAQLKMTRDTMYLLCIPNRVKLGIMKANVIYAKQINDIPAGKKPHVPLIKKSIGENEYNYYTMLYQLTVPNKTVQCLPVYAASNFIEPLIGAPGQPPETRTLS